MDSHPPNPNAVYRDRSSGLVIFGVLEILLGVFCALMVPLSLLASSVSGGSSSLRSTIPVLVVYAVVAAGMIWLGIGSIRARRWACDLTLSISRIWLVTGVCTVLVTGFMLPGMLAGMGAGEGKPPEALFVASVIIFAILGLIYVLLPAAFVLFYRSPDVAATCRARDPGTQFTDRCPPRLLTLAVVWGLGAVSVLVMPAYGWAFPFFGSVLSGAAGMVLWMVVLLVCGVLAWGTCRQRPWAWWGALAATIEAAASTVLTSIRVSPEEVVRALPLADDQRQVLASISWPEAWVMTLVWIVVWASMVIYLLTVRPEFRNTTPIDDD
ncbi:MAG: hypothetical protein QNL88_09805 [Acidobacteriota bacterium]|nr:hypothetical protein [Acidobacteriota bacterium]